MAYLMVELAVAGMLFVKATYNLEGDGPLVLAWQAHYPNLNAVANQISSGDAQMEQELIQYAKSCVQPGLTYYFHQLTTSMRELFAAFKAARLFSPTKLHKMRPSINVIMTP